VPLQISNGFLDGDDLTDFLPQGVTVESLLSQDTREPEDVEVVFMTQADERVRPEHAALHGTVWKLDDPNRPVPPLGYGCRCYEEYRAVNSKARRDTGLEVGPKNPPEPGDQALEQFWKEAEQSNQSEDPGGKVTPVDTFGPTAGVAIEKKEIKPHQAFDEGGDPQPASVIRSLTNGVSERSVFAATIR